MLVLRGLYYPSLSRASCLSRRLNQNWSACIKEPSQGPSRLATCGLPTLPVSTEKFLAIACAKGVPVARESLRKRGFWGPPVFMERVGRSQLGDCYGLGRHCKMLMPQCDFVVVLINFQSAKFKSLMRVKVELLEERKSVGPLSPRPCQGLSVRHLPCSQCKGSLS